MATNNTTPKWWEIQSIPKNIVTELRRRKNSYNLGINVPNNSRDITLNFKKNHADYKGPLTPWVRIFSNSTGKPSNTLVPGSKYLLNKNILPDYDGFILYGGEGFFNAWGYSQNRPLNETYSIIGYQANGKPHFISNEFRNQYSYDVGKDSKFPQNSTSSPMVPPPSIQTINIKQSKELLTYGTFKFKCFGLPQLEYLAPFFLTPNINVFIEFGWNLFNQDSLLELSKLEQCLELITKPQIVFEKSSLSYGNYGCISGIITNYNFNTDDGFVYDCEVTITSRQGSYAGVLIDSAPKSSIDDTESVTNNEKSKNFLDLKSFVTKFFPQLINVVKYESNFIDYVYKEITNELGTETESEEFFSTDQILSFALRNIPTITTLLAIQGVFTKSNAEQPDGSQELKRMLDRQPSKFYGGKNEDRIFCPRRQDIYKKSPIPNWKDGSYIQYDTNKDSPVSQISNVDKWDFDKDQIDETWVQLDFLFEVFNYFFSIIDDTYVTNITDVKISAHPNLISCDNRVLIPNPCAPKVNIGRKALLKNNSDNLPIGARTTGGYLRNENSLDPKKNYYLTQQPDIKISKSVVKNTYIKIKNAEDKGIYPTSDFEPIDSYYLACIKARNVFKTATIDRDDLDSIINYFYYKNNSVGSASFPIKNEYYNGYFKHLYVKSKFIVDLFQDSSIKTYKELIVKLLDVINESVAGFWKFEFVQNQSGKGMSIVDKNYIDFKKIDEVYTFELGSTENVVRNIKFDVSLTNESSTNILFGSTNNNLLNKFVKQSENRPDLTDSILTTANNTLPTKFNDRLDFFNVSGSISAARKNNIQDNIMYNYNPDIANLQTYGPKSQDGVLCVTVDNIKSSDIPKIELSVDNQSQNNIFEDVASRVTTAVTTLRRRGSDLTAIANYIEGVPTDDPQNPQSNKNYKFLCLPKSMKARLREMVDDLDFKNNRLYSGVVDNFQITLTFDGIFSFKNLQVFAINNLPKPYVPGNIVFQVLEVEHQITAGSWKTIVTALIRAVGSNKIKYELV